MVISKDKNLNSDSYVDEEYLLHCNISVSEPIHLTEELKNRIAAAGRASLTTFLTLSEQKMYACVYFYYLFPIYFYLQQHDNVYSYHCYCIGKFKMLASNYSYLFHLHIMIPIV